MTGGASAIASWPCPGTPHRGHTDPAAPCPLVPVTVELDPRAGDDGAPLDRFTTAGGARVEVYRHPDAGRPGVAPGAQLIRATWPPYVNPHPRDLDHLPTGGSPPPPDPLAPPPPDPRVLTPADHRRLAAIRARAPWYDVAPRVGAVEAFYDVAFLLDLVDRLARSTTEEEP